MIISVIETKLSDGSHGYDVKLGQSLHIPAITEHDAILLADKIATAVQIHTNEDCDIIYRWNS